MNNRGTIIAASVLVAVFAALGAFAYFFVKPLFDEYKEDERLRQSLEQTLVNLRDNFHGYSPELLMNAWQDKMQPWRAARVERSAYFNFGDWYEREQPPEDARMRKYWYVEATGKMLQDLYTEIYAKVNRYDAYPQDIRRTFNVATEQDWQGRDVSDDEIARNMDRLAFGVSVCRFLLGNNVTQVGGMSLWPRRFAKEYGDMLAMQTVGLQFTIATRDLVKMLEDLRMSDRYFCVDGIKITYPYIAYNVEPQLQVQMLLSQAFYRRQFVEGGGAAGGGAAGPAGVSPELVAFRRPSEVERAPVVEPGVFGKAWRWFKQNILVMH